MRNVTSNFEILNARSRLYRVWVPLRDDGKQLLVCIWIDSTMPRFKAQLERDNERAAEIEGEASEEGADGPIAGVCGLAGRAGGNVRTSQRPNEN